MPDQTGNAIVYRITPAGCLEQHPHPARLVLGSVHSVVLVADSANSASVTLTFHNPAMAQLFANPTAGPIVLAPGARHELEFRPVPELGIAHRDAHFGDDNPQFAHSVLFDSVPARCGGGDVNDVIVES